jgi:hypothetical protein
VGTTLPEVTPQNSQFVRTPQSLQKAAAFCVAASSARSRVSGNYPRCRPTSCARARAVLDLLRQGVMLGITYDSTHNTWPCRPPGMLRGRGACRPCPVVQVAQQDRWQTVLRANVARSRMGKIRGAVQR